MREELADLNWKRGPSEAVLHRRVGEVAWARRCRSWELGAGSEQPLEELGPQHRTPVQQSLALGGELSWALTQPLTGVEEGWD